MLFLKLSYFESIPVVRTAQQSLPKTVVPLKATYHALSSIAPRAARLGEGDGEEKKNLVKSASIFPGHLLT